MSGAKVELIEGVSYGPCPDKRTWKKGIPQLIYDPKSIEFYKNNSRFSVSYLESAGKVKSSSVKPAQGKILSDKETTEGIPKHEWKPHQEKVPPTWLSGPPPCQ